jgi:hypothetical protein
VYSFSWRFASHVTPCNLSLRLEKIARDTILAQVTETTTLEQFKEAMASLEQLQADLLKNKKTFHFTTSAGRHYCIADCYQDLTTSLWNQWYLRPKAPPEPAPRSPLETPEQVVADLNELIQHRPDETILGEDTEAT